MLTHWMNELAIWLKPEWSTAISAIGTAAQGLAAIVALAISLLALIVPAYRASRERKKIAAELNAERTMRSKAIAVSILSSVMVVERCIQQSHHILANAGFKSDIGNPVVNRIGQKAEVVALLSKAIIEVPPMLEKLSSDTWQLGLYQLSLITTDVPNRACRWT